MGKYDGVIKKLPKDAPGGEQKFREKVEARKRDIVELETKLVGSVKPAALATRYSAARRKKDLIGQEESDVNVDIAATEELMHAAFDGEGISSIKLADGTSITVSQEPTASVIDHDRLIAWAKANGYERMLTLYSQTVASLAKELLMTGEALQVDGDGNMTVMDGAVRLASKTKTTMRKG